MFTLEGMNLGNRVVKLSDAKACDRTDTSHNHHDQSQLQCYRTTYCLPTISARTVVVIRWWLVVGMSLRTSQGRALIFGPKMGKHSTGACCYSVQTKVLTQKLAIQRKRHLSRDSPGNRD